MDNKTKAAEPCDFKQGALPSCAPLAVNYIPFQGKNAPRYSANEALPRGTLFPGLDLPWMNKANSETSPVDPVLGELMAMSFALDELALYLDTHREDAEAFSTFKSCAEMYKAAREKYIADHGPLTQLDTAGMKSYTWLNDPWPWERSAN